MIQRVPSSPCLGERVAALADGTMQPDAATRALAHTTVCSACREALEVERLTIERLRALPAPTPSSDLVAALTALAEPGGPVPQRRGHVPGTARRPTTAVAAPGSYPAGWPGPRSGLGTGTGSGSGRGAGSVRPGGGRRGVPRRALVTAAAGALGVGALAVAAIGGGPALDQLRPGTRPPTSQLVGQPPSVRPAVDQATTDQFAVDHRFRTDALPQVSTLVSSRRPSGLVSPTTVRFPAALLADRSSR